MRRENGNKSSRFWIVAVLLLVATITLFGGTVSHAQIEYLEYAQSIRSPADSIGDIIDRCAETSLNSYYGDLGPYLDHIWPISGTTDPGFPFSDTYGPRWKTSESRYDWHRGVDIPVDYGTEVYAIADGTVTKAGEDASYSDPLVQVKHTKSDGGYYLSNYLHMSGWVVAEGDSVSQGDVIGYSGMSDSGFEHLHFEIRDNGYYQMYCVHPMYAMPYVNTYAPEVSIDNVDLSDPESPVVEVTVTVVTNELDLAAIEVCVYEDTGSGIFSYEEIDYHRLDFMHWTYLHTPTETGHANDYLDTANIFGVEISPAEFSSSYGTWEISVTIRVYAEDVEGLYSCVGSNFQWNLIRKTNVVMNPVLHR